MDPCVHSRYLARKKKNSAKLRDEYRLLLDQVIILCLTYTTKFQKRSAGICETTEKVFGLENRKKIRKISGQ